MHTTSPALDLAERLTAGARTPDQRAALSLLLALPYVYARSDAAERWYGQTPGNPPFVRWDRVAADVDSGAVPVSPGERAALVLAASIAGRRPVVLAEVLPLLDDGLAAGLVVALHTLVSPVTTPAPDHVRFAGGEER